jgi:hydrogenase maturation protease
VMLHNPISDVLERKAIPREYPPVVLVLGIGNPLMGDDGVGSQVIQLLAENELPCGIKIENAGLPGWGLPAWFEGWNHVIL